MWGSVIIRMNFEEEVTRATQSTWLHDISDRFIITTVQLSDISDRFFITSIQLSEGFFVPAHPLWMILVPYIVYLTFASFLSSLLPATRLVPSTGSKRSPIAQRIHCEIRRVRQVVSLSCKTLFDWASTCLHTVVGHFASETIAENHCRISIQGH